MKRAEMQLDDSAVRNAIENDLDRSLIIEAAAGTGKTTELVRRITNLIATGRCTVDGLVAVTFTRKAAGELKLRLREHLDVTRETEPRDEVRARLDTAIARLEEARIGTIHSFCAELLRERPVEGHVDPGFEELDEVAAADLYGAVFDLWVQERLAAPTPALRRVLERKYQDDSPLGPLRAAGWKLCEWRDFPAPWKKVAFNLPDEVDRLVGEVAELAKMAGACGDPTDNLRQDLQHVIDFVARVKRAEEVRARDPYALEALLYLLRKQFSDCRNRKGRGEAYAPNIKRQDVIDARERLVENLDNFRERAEANLAQELREELRTLVDAYEARKKRSGKLDFVDLLLLARNLVRDNATVRGFLQLRFTHILVDEFQDTDPLQAEILLLLSAANPDATNWQKVTPKEGKLFVVGDPKQSIYRFRRADVLLYEQVRRGLGERGVPTLYLTRSYRAVETIQKAVNTAFSQAIQQNTETGQPAYVPLTKYAEAPADRPSVVALSVPRVFSAAGNVTQGPINESLPGAVCGFIEWLLKESGWKVRDYTGQYVPARPRDIALLFRHLVSFNADCTRPFVRGLENRGIPHVLVSERSFHSREEVGTLRAALNAIEWPDDELSVYATLHGPLFAFTDEQLLRFRQAAGRLNPFRKCAEDLPEDLRAVAAALEMLAKLHSRRNRRPVVETLSALLAATRAAAGFALRPAGQQVLGNVERVCEMARGFEARGGLSFRSFVQAMEGDAEDEQSTGGAVLEAAAEGVRIMSVHAAKGLEFPVVIPCDMTTKLARKEPERYVDPERGLCAVEIAGCKPQDLLDNAAIEHQRDEAEGIRIAYVAATRARDLLVVPAVGVEKRDGWISPLNAALYPEPALWSKSKAATGCPCFGNDSVYERDGGARALNMSCVRPGLHVVGNSEVVWWDPAVLKLEAPPQQGLSREDTLYGPAEAKEASIEQRRRWATEHARRIEAGIAPQFEILLPSQGASVSAGSVTVAVETTEREVNRPRGSAFGTLVHTVISQAPLDAAEEVVRRLAELHGRTLGSSSAEANAAAKAVCRALHHPLVARACAAQRVFREVPITLALGGNRVLEAVIDLAYLDANGWHIVDFKTDADAVAGLSRHEQQLTWYAQAFTQLVAKPASVSVLYV